ncbi:hypothetical protein [Parabacteroides pacaensis]|uniref:hypothetical protein n=1 Tax=Parabacteroides pacaensis TaxID=2086575 RepID=UPI000D0E5E48|nr:hypothetical protein [Parabacteroides pacaensis]
MMKKKMNYFDLNQIGLLELIFAFYPILSGYAYGALKMDLLVLLVMDVIVLLRPCKKWLNCPPLLWLMFFILLHELILFFYLGADRNYLFNTIIGYFITFISIFIIAPALNYKKLVGSLMWVGILSAGGILYHFYIIQTGGVCHPIKLPFMPDLASDTRLFEEVSRPTSFYWEPAAFVTYMMVPLFISLYQRKFLLTGGIIFVMFLSTSSTGILLSIIICGIYILTQKVKLRYKLILLSLAGSMIVFLLSSEMFEAGVTKIEKMDIENTSRLINGPSLIMNMPFEHLITGMLEANVIDYNRINPSNLIWTHSGDIFVSSFWLVWAKFGIIGLFLYLNLYYRLIKSTIQLLPYGLILIIAMFFQGFMFSAIFAFQIIFMVAFQKSVPILYEKV